MRIMTMNIWGDYFNNPVEIRKDGIVKTIKKYSPDILGVQEITNGWYNSDLFSDIGDKYILVEGVKGNFTPLLYKKERFDLIERGWELFVETPDPSKSFTWAVLREKQNQKKIAVINAHLWWMDRNVEDDMLRAKNARQLFEAMENLKNKYNIQVFAFGDFNCKEGSLAMKFLESKGINSSYKLAVTSSNVSSHHGDPVLGDDGKYHGTKTENDSSHSIDHIVTYEKDAWISEYKVVEDKSILDATDHSPVYIDFLF